MISGFKINTALLICLAFIFRLLTVSAGTVSGLSTATSVSAKKNVIAVVKKRKSQIDPLENSTTPKYSAVEISEEGSDDDDVQHKFSTPFLIQFNISLADNLRTQSQPISPFNKYYTCNSVQRHLEFRVFRV